MQFQFTPYLVFLLFSAGGVVLLAYHTWRHHLLSHVPAFGFLEAAAALWVLANACEMAGADIPTKLFWANVQFVVYGTVPILSLTVVLQSSGRSAWITRRRLAVLFIIPAVTVILAWTDGFHGLLRRDLYLDVSGPFPVLGKTLGIWWKIHAAYSYCIIIAALLMLLSDSWRSASPYRSQSRILLAGFALPALVNAAYVLRLTPWPGFDVTPAFNGISGGIVAWGLFRYHLFDLLPIARSMIVDHMTDGMIVLDIQDRVVDANLPAQHLMGRPLQAIIGLQVGEALAFWPALNAFLAQEDVDSTDLVLDSESPAAAPRYYEAHQVNLHHPYGDLLGRLILLHDRSERRLAKMHMIEKQRALAVLEERENLARELHDNLGQALSFAHLQAEVARTQLLNDTPTEANATLKRLSEVVQEAQRDVREYILGVHAAPKAENDFAQTLNEYINRFGQRYDLTTRLIIHDGTQVEFGPELQMQLLRIVQEALNNVRKHACARQARVVLGVQDGTAQLLVEDDGCGFAPQALDGGGPGYGLKSMRERAATVGGEVKIESAPGRGTRISVQFPLSGMGGTDAPATGR